MGIVEATRAYEAWLARQLGGAIVRKDLRRKHAGMAKGPFEFLRATYYRWAEEILNICPELKHAPSVLAVGDIHLENFGSWRDNDGRLIWGVNDFDEVWRLTYSNDLIRLATSAFLAVDSRELDVTPKRGAALILGGYRAALTHGGRAARGRGRRHSSGKFRKLARQRRPADLGRE